MRHTRQYTIISRLFKPLTLLLVAMLVMASCSEQDDLNSSDIQKQTQMPISFSVNSTDTASTRATLIGKSNFNSIVKQIKVSAFKSDGTVFMNAVPLNNDGNGNFDYANNSDRNKYYWPSDGSKLTFVAWYGDDITIDNKGNLSYNKLASDVDNLYYQSSLGTSDVRNGKVAISLSHAYKARTFDKGEYFTPKTFSYGGITWNVGDGYFLINKEKARESGDSCHITGNWTNGSYTKVIDTYFPSFYLSSTTLFDDTNVIGHYKIRENKPYFGYKGNKKYNWNVGYVGKPVDLGLSIKWADCNIGANKTTDYGASFYWADVEPYVPFKDIPYFPGNATKYNDNDGKTILEPSDDAAHVIWGGSWRMPTKEEFQELLDSCTYEKITVDGVLGYKFTGPNGNNIFLPYHRSLYTFDHNNYEESSLRFEYWSSTIRFIYDYPQYNFGTSLSFDIYDQSKLAVTTDVRSTPLSIRPVCP